MTELNVVAVKNHQYWTVSWFEIAVSVISVVQMEMHHERGEAVATSTWSSYQVVSLVPGK